MQMHQFLMIYTASEAATEEVTETATDAEAVTDVAANKTTEAVTDTGTAGATDIDDWLTVAATSAVRRRWK